jgi:hypothetical protein
MINKDMSAIYADFEVESLAFDGKTLTFDVTIEVEGSELPLEFEGDMTDPGTIEGVFLMEGQEVATVVIARAGGASGTWNITSDSQFGVIEHELIFSEDGSVATVDGTDARDVSIDGNAVSFQIELDVEGQSFDLTFEGEVDGSSIGGAFLLDGQEVADIEGTKAQ